jgi:hypothetical protein
MTKKFLYSTVLVAVTSLLPLGSLSADENCPVFQSKQDINPFQSAVQSAVLQHFKQGDRYTFKFLGHTWFIETKGYNSISQTNIPKKAKYLITLIDSTRSEHEGPKLRCYYKAKYQLVYAPETTGEFDFHMTRVIQ